MTYVLQLAKRPKFIYAIETLSALHYMMVHFDLSKHPGNLRPGPISVYDSENEEVVYRGPDAESVEDLLQELMGQLNGDEGSPTFVRAAMAHLNLVMIHPFADGNGRMGRCLQSLVLARHFPDIDPNFVSIESYLGRNTRAYYDILGVVGQGGWDPRHDARPWIDFCLTAHYRSSGVARPPHANVSQALGRPRSRSRQARAARTLRACSARCRRHVQSEELDLS